MDLASKQKLNEPNYYAGMIKNSPTSRIYFSQRLRLHYVDWGNEKAPPLLLIHGGRDHCRNWDWVAEALQSQYHIMAPDLRGHGDSQWMIGGGYSQIDYVYDIAQLVRQNRATPVTIIGHSMGGAISLLYTALYPETVVKLVSIEGMGAPLANRDGLDGDELANRFRAWISQVHGLSARLPRRYPSLEDAYRRMQEVNPHLSEEQARHLTIQGSNQGEDGSYTWKFDNYVRMFAPIGLSGVELAALYRRITCPTQLVYGKDSWAMSLMLDGRANAIHDVRVEGVDDAGHWVHHDKLEQFLELVRQFLDK